MAYSKKEFYEKCKIVHNNYYEYTYDFTKVENLITVICPIHGEYKTKGSIHLYGSKCPYCAGKKTKKEEVIKKIEENSFHLLEDFKKISDIVSVQCKNGHITKRRVWDLYKRNKIAECFICSQQTRKKTKIDKGLIIPDEQLPLFKLYTRIVWKLTSRTINDYPNKIKNLKKRSRNFHLDHKFSIKMGFLYNILPFYIAKPNNLEVIDATQNLKKNWKSSITEQELFEGSETIL